MYKRQHPLQCFG